MNKEKQGNKVGTPKTKRSILLKILIFLLILMLLIPLLLHFGPVQNFIVGRVTKNISKQTNSQVSIESVDFSIFSGLILEDFYASSPNAQNDTMLHVGKFSSTLKDNIFSLLNNRIAFTELYLKDAQLNIKTLENDSISNLQAFMAGLSKSEPKSKSSKSDLEIDLSIVHLENFTVISDDLNQKKNSYIHLQKGELEFNDILLDRDSISISKLYLTEPVVHLSEKYTQAKISDDKIVTSDQSDSDVVIAVPLGLSIEHVKITDGNFRIKKEKQGKSITPGSIDYDNLDVQEIHIDSENLSISRSFDVSSKIKALSLIDQNGFEIKDLHVEQFGLNNNQLLLSDFALETSNSKIQNYLEFNYDHFGDFGDFSRKIEIVSDMRKSELALEDLKYFFGDLSENSFFKINKNRSLYITGIVNGTINNLEADQLVLAVDNKISLAGAISTSNLLESDKALINMYIDELKSNLSDLKTVIPGFNPPDQFLKLDPIVFTGDIEGFFNDFVIYGALDSRLGNASLDMRLDTKGGVENAKYSGKLALNDFDLAAWTDNPDFGNTTLTAQIIDGEGLTADKLNTELQTQLNSFHYKGYDYSDISLNGVFEKNQFDGLFKAEDPNFNLDFDGIINLQDAAFTSEFKADIYNIDPVKLNLSKDFSKVQGSFDLSLNGSSATDFTGTALIKNVDLTFKEKLFEFDSLYLTSSPTSDTERNVVVDSDLLFASIDGQFDLGKIDKSVQYIIYKNHRGWADYLGINRPSVIPDQQDFNYKIQIKDTKDYLELASIQNLNLKGADINGHFDSANEKFVSTINIEEVRFKDELGADSLTFALNTNGKESDIQLDLKRVLSGLKYRDPLSLKSNIIGDQIQLDVVTSNLLDSLESLAINIDMEPRGKNIHFHIEDQDINMFGSNWKLSSSNEIVYGDKYFEVKDLALSDGHRQIIIDGSSDDLRANFKNLDFLLINGIIDYDKIDFAGEGDMQVSVQNLFNKPRVNLDMIIPKFTLNDEDYGTLTASITDRNDGKVNAIVLIDKPEDELIVKVDGELIKDTKALDGDITIRNLPMDIFEFIIEDGISRTSGEAIIDAAISGTLDDIKLDGVATINDGYTQINYLSNYLNLGSEPITITEKYIDLSLLTLTDRLGNVANMEGGLNHYLFGDFTSDLTMTSERFLALDTDKYDNAMYYGTGIGDMTVSFYGPFHSTDIEVTAITGPGTLLNVPVEDSYDNYNESFIKFIDRDAPIDSLAQAKRIEGVKLEGVDVEMNLSVTQDADVNIIFNEATNDIIRGKGEGDLRVVVSREGEFNVFGDYEVYSGEYLFRAWGVVTKPFQVKQGGLITWTGDPINANLNIEADYEDVRVPTNIFLAEYIENGSPALKQEAGKRTDVDLTMKLTGTLYNPVIGFDIAFPDLQGELKTFADAKMRTLYENEADLNEQVAGLIIFRSFLPSNSFGNVVATGRGVVETGYNTLSEFISNQLSFWISGILQESLKDEGFISGIDFEIGISKNASLLQDLNTGGNNYLPDEIEVNFKPRFQNDKWGIDYGTSFVNTKDANRTYLIHDFALEYFLTDDRRLKIRIYGKWDKDQFQYQNEQKYGVGLNYRKEFGNLVDFKKTFKDDVSNGIKGEGTQ